MNLNLNQLYLFETNAKISRSPLKRKDDNIVPMRSY